MKPTTKPSNGGRHARLILVAGVVVVACACWLALWPQAQAVQDEQATPPDVAPVTRSVSARTTPHSGAPPKSSPAPQPIARLQRPGPAEPEPEPNARPLTSLLEPDESTAQQLHAAHEFAVSSCMRERGFAYRPQLDRAGTDPNAAMLDSMTKDEQSAWKRALMGALDEPDDSVELVVSDQAQMRWSASSCTTVARRTMYGNEAAYHNLRMQLTQVREQAYDKARSDPRYGEAHRAYANCMRARGSPLDADSEDDIEAAQTEPAAECQQLTRLLDVQAATVASAEQELAEQHQAELDAFQAIQLAALASD